MGFSRTRNPVGLARVQQLIQFPSRFERCPIFTDLESHLEYRSVTICGKRYSALVDNQASLNMMSLAFVKNAGLLLYPDNTAFQLSDGSICHAIGRVRTRCALVRASQNGWQSIAHQEFYVLKTAFAPLVLGSPFQQETGFFEPCYHHVSPQKTSRAQLTATRSAHPSCYATWCLKVLLIHQHLAHEAIAMPDSGSSLNLISLAYAMAVGFHLDRSSGAEVPLTIGNGRTVFTLGKVHTTIQLHPSASSLKQARITFLVVKGLVTDVVLGRHFSKKNLLLASRHPNLQWILIERDTPGFLGSSDKGYNPKPMTKKKAERIDLPKGQARCNQASNRLRTRHAAKAKPVNPTPPLVPSAPIPDLIPRPIPDSTATGNGAHEDHQSYLMSGASNTETKGEPEDPTTAMDHSPSTVGTTSTTTGQSSSNTSAEQPPPEKLHSDGKRGIFKRFRKDHELQLKST